MRVLFIGRSDSGEKNDVKIMSRLLSHKSQASEISVCNFEDIVIKISRDRTELQINLDDSIFQVRDFNLVIVLGWSHSKVYSDIAKIIAMEASKAGVGVWNSELINARSMTKLSQLYIAANTGAEVSKSVFSIDKNKMLRHIQELKLPVILKDITASRGRRNYLKSGYDEVETIFKDENSTAFIAQAFVENDSSDLRFIVAGGKVCFVMRRHSSGGTHLSNISAGGRGEVVSLDSLEEELIKNVETLAKKFGREFCGVDYIYDIANKKYVFLEINMTPQIVNGAFVDEKISSIINIIEKETEMEKKL